MIILHIFDQIFKTHICHDKQIVDHVYFVQNSLALAILLYSCKYMYLYYFRKNTQALIDGSELLLKYLAYDLLFIEKPTMYIHHGIVFGMLYYFQTIPELNIEIVQTQFAALIYTEISSIFLSLIFMQKYIRKHFSLGTWFDHVYLFNKMTFLVTFIITRIVYYPIKTIFNSDFISLLMENPERLYESYHILFLFSGLFILNAYWAGIILKTAFFTSSD